MTDETHRLVGNATDPNARYAAHSMSGFTYLHTNDPLEVRRHFLTEIDLGQRFDREEKNTKTLLYGLDIEVAD